MATKKEVKAKEAAAKAEKKPATEHRTFDQAFKEKAVKAFLNREGKTVTEIAAEFGVSSVHLYKWSKSLGKKKTAEAALEKDMDDETPAKGKAAKPKPEPKPKAPAKAKPAPKPDSDEDEDDDEDDDLPPEADDDFDDEDLDDDEEDDPEDDDLDDDEDDE